MRRTLEGSKLRGCFSLATFGILELLPQSWHLPVWTCGHLIPVWYYSGLIAGHALVLPTNGGHVGCVDRYDPSGLSLGSVLCSLPNPFYPSCSQQEGCHIENLRAFPVPSRDSVEHLYPWDTPLGTLPPAHILD